MGYIKMSSFLTKQMLDGNEYIVGIDSRNIKIPIQSVKDYFNLSAFVAFGGIATPASTPPAEGDMFWVATEPGTYTNYGGVVVPETSFAVITRINGSFDVSAITFDLGDYPTIEEMEIAIAKAMTSDMVLSPELTSLVLPPAGTSTITQTEDADGLRVSNSASSTSTLTLLETKGFWGADVYKVRATFKISNSSEAANPGVGVGFGDAADNYTGAVKRSDGHFFSVKGSVSEQTYHWNGTAPFDIGDTVTVEVRRRDDRFDTRYAVNGVFSDWYLSNSAENVSGKIMILYRGSSITSVKIDVFKGQGIYDGEIKPILKTIEEIQLGGIVDRLENAPYDMTSSVSGLPDLPSPGVTTENSSTPYGLTFKASSGTSSDNPVAFLETDLEYPAEPGVLVFKFKVNDIISITPGIGIGFGNPTTGQNYLGVVMRSNGQIFGLKITPETTILSGWAGRSANASYGFVEGDTVQMEFDFIKQTMKIWVNDIAQPTLNNMENVIPSGNVFINFRGQAEITEAFFVKKTSSSDEPQENENGIYHVATTGSDTNSGNEAAPFATINKAIEAMAEKSSGAIIISGGDYREIVNLGGLPTGDFIITNREGQKVRVLGSNQLTGWTKTTGRTNVYETPFTGSVPAWSRHDNPIFEDGRPSKEVLPGEQHPLQKNLQYRLPFTDILEVADVTLVDSTPGSYCTEAGVLYIHTSDSNDPSANGYNYEVIARSANSILTAATTPKKVNIKMKGIQFMYTTTGLRLTGFNDVELQFVVSLATSGAGAICPNTGNNKLYFCEGGFCNGDGFNGHFSGYAGYASLSDNRSNYPTTHYIGCWGHDNFDDGESSHEQHNVIMDATLLEYNGDSGCRPSNDSTYYAKHSIFRYNGWQVGHGGSAGKGEGFAVVNPPLNPERQGCRAVLINCVSYGNNTGYGSITSENHVLELIDCISRDNATAEYYAGTGLLILRNCKATNADPSKIKVSGTGTIEVYNDLEVS